MLWWTIGRRSKARLLYRSRHWLDPTTAVNSMADLPINLAALVLFGMFWTIEGDPKPAWLHFSALIVWCIIITVYILLAAAPTLALLIYVCCFNLLVCLTSHNKIILRIFLSLCWYTRYTCRAFIDGRLYRTFIFRSAFINAVMAFDRLQHSAMKAEPDGTIKASLRQAVIERQCMVGGVGVKEVH